MKLVKIILIPFFTLLLSVSIYAQKPNKEKIKALKMAHITEQLDLTTEEAQAFWPIYNANEEERSKLRDNSIRHQIEEISNSKSEITEREAKELLEKINKIEDAKHKAEKEYNRKLSTVLSSRKTIKLMYAEHSFRYKMIKEFKERHRKGKQKNKL